MLRPAVALMDSKRRTAESTGELNEMGEGIRNLNLERDRARGRLSS
jgi:hypothetical protein